MAGLHGGTSANVVKTALDDVFSQTFSGDKVPGHATAEDSLVFNQDTTDSSAEIVELLKGVGAWEERAELGDVTGGSPRVANQKTFSVVNFARSIDISKNLFDDNKHSTYEKAIENFARRARTTRDKNAMAPFRLGFTTATTADAVAVFSNSHTNLNGDTVDNLATPALAEAALNTLIVQMWEMKSQDGEIDGFIPKCLLVPPALYKTGALILDTELRSGTANNDANVYSTRYGIELRTSPYLGAAAGGSDTAWFLLGEGHSVNRYVRQAVQTQLVDWQYQRNNNYVYKGEFREVVGVLSHEGLIGSNGTT